MKRYTLLRLTRPVLLTTLVLMVLILGWGGSPWKTQAQGGGTIPVATPNGSNPGSGSGSPSSPGVVATSAAVPPPTVEGQVAPPIVGVAPVGPNSAITITSGNEFCQVGITRGDIAVEGTIALTYVTADKMPMTANGYSFAGGGGCEIKFTRSSATTNNQHARFVAFRQPVDPDIIFVSPIDMCLFYTDTQLSAVNGQVGAFQVLFNNVRAQRWEPLTVTVDQDNHMVCGQTQKAGQFGLVYASRSNLPGSLPDTSGPRSAPAVSSGAPQSAARAQAAAPSAAPNATAPAAVAVAATSAAPTIAAPQAVAAVPAPAAARASAVADAAPPPNTPWAILGGAGIGMLVVITAAVVVVRRRRPMIS